MRATLTTLEEIARDRIADLLADAYCTDDRLRLVFRDTSFCDARIAETIPNRFSFHWERRHLDGTFYRYDTFPDRAARTLKTFPLHFHDGTQHRIVAPPFRHAPLAGFEDFLVFMRSRIEQRARPSRRRIRE